jgi:hypothetical protein
VLLSMLGFVCILSACNDITKQKRLAVMGAERFQSLYNSGSCQQIYEQASHHFQMHETPVRWLRDCDHLRKRFGRWAEFRPNENNSWPFGDVGIVWVRGPAQFDNASGQVRLDWDLSNDHPALFNVLIVVGDEQISLPGFTGEVRK